MKWILKETLNGEPVLDGIIPGIGVVRHGESVTAYTPAQEELLKADPRFKQYRESATEKGVTEADKVVEVKPTETEATGKAAKSGKEG